jgi:hypothetical protein
MKNVERLLKTNQRKAFFLAVVFLAWVQFTQADLGGPNIFEDRDRDGLTDSEERALGTDPEKDDTDGDSYKDGAEVQSGYNPLIPAPGDKLIAVSTTEKQTTKTELSEVEEENNISQENVDSGQINEQASGQEPLILSSTNLTERFIENLKNQKGDQLEVLQDFGNNPEEFQTEDKMAELANLSLTQEELNNLLQDTMRLNEEDKMELLPESEIKVLPVPEGNEEEVKATVKKQVEEYVVAAGYIALKNAPFEVSNQQQLETQTDNFISQMSSALGKNDISQINELNSEGRTVLEEMKKLEVPYELKNSHLTLVSILNYLLQQDPVSVVDQTDPLKQILTIGKLQAVIGELQAVQTEVQAVLDKYDVEMFNPNNVLNSIDSEENN